VGVIVSYLPEPESHPLWPEIAKLLEPAAEGSPIRIENELVWIAFEGPVLFGAGTTILYDDGTVQIRLCGGFEHRKWVREAEAMVSAWARKSGAGKLTMRGRKGWARYFTRCGWAASEQDRKTQYEKVL
jgi:hypothetical protein